MAEPGERRPPSKSNESKTAFVHVHAIKIQKSGPREPLGSVLGGPDIRMTRGKRAANTGSEWIPLNDAGEKPLSGRSEEKRSRPATGNGGVTMPKENEPKSENAVTVVIPRAGSAVSLLDSSDSKFLSLSSVDVAMKRLRLRLKRCTDETETAELVMTIAALEKMIRLKMDVVRFSDWLRTPRKPRPEQI